jgi:hypothetical protein
MTMTTTNHNPLPALLLTGALLTLNAGAIPAATTPRSGSNACVTARRTAPDTLSLRLDPRCRLVYTIDMSSQAALDMRAALRQQDPGADISRAPRMTLTTELRGDIEMVPVDHLGPTTRVLCTIHPDQLRLQADGTEVAQSIPQLIRRLRQPFLVEYTRQGQVARVHFDRHWDTTAQGFARALLGYLQVTLPDRADQASWRAREAEPNGRFLIAYSRQARTQGTLTLRKAKTAAVTTQTAPSAHQLRGTRTILPSGALTLVLDADRGILRSLRGEERFDTTLGAAHVAQSRNTVAIALQKRLPVTTAQHDALLQIARRQARQVPGISLAQMPDTSPQQEARIQRANLGDATQEQILAQLAALDHSLTPDRSARQLLPRLKACIYLYPQFCRTLQARLLTAPPDGIRMALVVEALRAAGHSAAQQTLIRLALARRASVRALGLLIPTLAQLASPIPQVDALLQQIAFGRSDPFVASMACLSLGALANTLTPIAPERARHLTLVLENRLQRCPATGQKQTLLLALANAAQPATLPTLLHEARDRFPAVRGSALLALGRLPGPQPERAICLALASDRDASVRLAAALATGGHLRSAAIRQSLLEALRTDRDVQIRLKALSALWGGARSRPEVVTGVRTASSQDASEDVRRAARTLLAQQ